MSSPQIQQMIETMNRSFQRDSALGGTLKLDFGSSGSLVIDSKAGKVLEGDDRAADCTISIDMDTFQKVRRGEIDQTSAFMQGKLRVMGDMAIALKLNQLLKKMGT